MEVQGRSRKVKVTFKVRKVRGRWPVGLLCKPQSQSLSSGLWIFDLGLGTLGLNNIFPHILSFLGRCDIKLVELDVGRVVAAPLPVAHSLLQHSVPEVSRNLKCNSPDLLFWIFRSSEVK